MCQAIYLSTKALLTVVKPEQVERLYKKTMLKSRDIEKRDRPHERFTQ